MAVSPRRWRRAAAVFAVVSVVAAPVPVPGQDRGPSTDEAVKAAFLFNFVKFAEWPALPAGATLITCVVGSEGVAARLADIVRGKDIGGRGLNVVRPGNATSWGDCHLLFVTGSQLAPSSEALTAIRGLPVLSVSDGTGFARAGGIIEFYIDSGRMRFAINVDAAQRAGLRLSSRLLGLATIIRDRNAP